MLAKLVILFLVGFFVSNYSVASAQDNQNDLLTPVEQGTVSADSPVPSPSSTPVPAAVQPVNLSVSPISVNVSTDPGSTTTSSIRIRNNSDKPEFLQLRLSTFSANPAGDAPIIRDFDETDPAKNWLTFSESEFRVSPGEWKTIQLTFSPDQSAALAYYYAILVERQAEAAAEEGTSLITGVPAILVLTEVRSPLAKRQLELVSFSSTNRLYEYLPTQFEIIIKNTGNVPALPVGDIFIDGQRTNDIGIMQLNPAKGMILPGTERKFIVQWDDGFPKYIIKKNELGVEKKELEWDFSKADRFRIGKFTATTLFVYDDGERDVPTEATVSFWVIPWRLIGLVIGIIILDLFRSKVINLIKRGLSVVKQKVLKT